MARNGAVEAELQNGEISELHYPTTELADKIRKSISEKSGTDYMRRGYICSI